MSQNFIEKEANKYGEAFQEQIINKLIAVAGEIVDIDKAIEEQNAAYLKEHESLMKDLAKKSSKEEMEEFKKMEPKKVEFKNSAEKFAYVYNLLLSKGYSMLHDVDAEGKLFIKVFKLDFARYFKLKGNYKVSIDNI